MKIKPHRLQPGSTIGIIAPAGPPDRTRLARGVAFLHDRGFKTRVYNQAKKKLGYLAGNDKSRADAINEAFADKSIDAVFCARGGYGSLRLLPQIDFGVIKRNPKIFLGYSDITVLLLSIYRKTGLITFHGPMPAVELGRTIRPYTVSSLLDSLGGQNRPTKFIRPKGYRIKTLNGGKAKGTIVGGNLCLMTRLIGTGFLPSFRDKIVFFEDTEEEPYRVDGYLSHLLQATDFSRARAYIIGEFTRTESRYGQSSGWTVEKAIRDYFSGVKRPCVYGFPCGHGKEKITIPIGTQVTFDADNKSLVFEESGVI